MRRVALCVAAVVLTALPARADRILYATANAQDNLSANRVDGFCLRGDGELAPTPTHRASVNGLLPRRLLVRNNAASGIAEVLYVAERDRVEAYAIKPGGGLDRIGTTRLLDQMIPRDLALSADNRILYVPQPLRNRVLSYPLNDDGSPKNIADDDPTLTCVQGQAASKYDNVIASGNRLYVSAPGTNRIEVFALAADGKIESGVINSDGTTGPALSGSTCLKAVRDTTPVTSVLSTRTRLQGARSILLNGNVLFVEERFVKRVSTFALTADGLFDPAVPVDKKQKDKLQQRRGRTAKDSGYDALLIFPPATVSPPPTALTLYGTQFFHGRIDAFAIPAGGQLPMRPDPPLKVKVRTKEDLKTSPVRMIAADATLYVAGGSLDRIQAYRIRTADGMLKSTTPFSRTDEQKGSFPNDVAIAVLSGNCD